MLSEKEKRLVDNYHSLYAIYVMRKQLHHIYTADGDEDYYLVSEMLHDSEAEIWNFILGKETINSEKNDENE